MYNSIDMLMFLVSVYVKTLCSESLLNVNVKIE